jgi:hypothetical protein
MSGATKWNPLFWFIVSLNIFIDGPVGRWIERTMEAADEWLKTRRVVK